MSRTYSPAAAAARQARLLIRRTASQLTGKQRGPDHADDRRVPRRNSYEENDPRAKPWRKVGDGSITQGIVHREALVETAEELRLQLWREYPLGEVRRRRMERDAFVAELEDLGARSPAEVPVGRPATLRTAIVAHDEWLERASGRLSDKDVSVLRALLTFLDFATGKLFPTLKTIADRAGCHENKVISALARLKRHGLIDWVRRTTRTGNEGEAGPQLEQTSNAYLFDHRRSMASRTWQTYWRRLCAKLRRLGAIRPPDPTPAPAASTAPLTPLGAAVASLGASLQSVTT